MSKRMPLRVFPPGHEPARIFRRLPWRRHEHIWATTAPLRPSSPPFREAAGRLLLSLVTLKVGLRGPAPARPPTSNYLGLPHCRLEKRPRRDGARAFGAYGNHDDGDARYLRNTVEVCACFRRKVFQPARVCRRRAPPR